MQDTKIQEAIAYNKKQGYSVDEIKLIQGTVGATQDGAWGPRTVEAVAAWQSRRELAVDGKVGPSTWARIKGEVVEQPKPPIPHCKPKHGIWVDDPNRILKAQYWDDMLEHGVTSVALMYERHSPAFDPHYSYSELETVCQLAGARDMEVGITDWPWPTPEWMAAAEKHMRRIFDPADLGLPIAYYESDVEGNWLRSKVKGYPNIDKAGDALVDMKTRVVAGTNARRETTSFTSHTENGRAADVAPHMDAVFNQCYAVRGRKRKNPTTGKYDLDWDVPWDHTYGPGNMVKHTLDRSLQIPGIDDGVPKLGAGLAAYDQKWPGHTAQEAMQKSYDVALEYGVFEIRWWSFKWMFGHLATSYGKPFLKSIAG